MAPVVAAPDEAPSIVLEAPEADEVAETVETVQAAPAPAPTMVFEDDAVAGQPVASDDGEELLLDQQIEPNPLPRSGSRWLAADESETSEAPAAVQPPAGATLFERMSNIARTAIKPEETEAKADPLDIPRFLNRQNNQ
jgi:cell division protein FtsZ